jgi:hypothetical protein
MNVYLWGFRWRQDSLAAFLMDANSDAVDGTSMQIRVDTISVGLYPITRRANNGGGFQVSAEIPKNEWKRILELIHSGASLDFVMKNVTYNAPLTGAPQAIGNFRSCSDQARNLEAAQAH